MKKLHWYERLYIYCCTVGIALLLTLICFDCAAQSKSCVFNVYSASGVDSAVAALKRGEVCKINICTSDIVSDIVLPYQWPGTSKMLVIDFNGCTLKGVIRSEVPPSYKTAIDIATQYKVVIRDGMLSGFGFDTLINLTSFLNIDVNNMRFRSAAVAGYFAYTMNGRVTGCDATNMRYAGFIADRLRLPHADTVLQSNNMYFAHDRVFNFDSCLYSFGSFGNNNLSYYMDIVEGKKPRVGFAFDDLGITTVKMVSYEKNHCETQAYKSMFDVRLNDGSILFADTWNQKISPVLYSVNSGAGAIVNVTGNPNILSGDRFKTTATAKWNMYGNKRFDLTTIWKDVKPSQFDYRYYYQNVSQWYNSNGNLNGKKILLQ